MEQPFKPQMANYRNGAKTIAYYEDEVFKPYPNDRRFLVSDRGSVYDSKDGVLLVPFDATWSSDPNRALNPYQRYHLIGHYGSVSTHRLVMETFAPIADTKGMDVNHIDGNKRNNRWSMDPETNNLEWISHAENVRHAYDSGLVNTAERGYTSYTEEQIHEICQLLQRGYSTKQVGLVLGYSGFNFYRLVSDLRRGKVWCKVTSQYNLPQAASHTEEEVILICELLMQRLNDREVSERMKEYGYDTKPGFIKSIRYKCVTWAHIIKDYDFPRPGKYSDETIEKICQWIEEGKKASEMAKFLGIEFTDSFKSIVSQIRHGTLYQGIANKYKMKKLNRSPFDEEQLMLIVELMNQGKSYKQIAEALGIPYTSTFSSTISQIRTGSTYSSKVEGATNGSGFSVSIKPKNCSSSR